MKGGIRFHRAKVLPMLAGVPGFFQQFPSSRSSAVFARVDHAAGCFERVVSNAEAKLTDHQGSTICIESHYIDPIDGSISPNQGIRILMVDGSRVVFRLSGTAGSGATVRMYLEKYENNPALVGGVTKDALKELVDVAFEISQVVQITGFTAPTVIT